MKYANEIYVDFFNAVQNGTWKEEKKKKYYSEEEVQELIRKSIQFERSKSVRKIFKKYFGDD